MHANCETLVPLCCRHPYFPRPFVVGFLLGISSSSLCTLFEHAASVALLLCDKNKNMSNLKFSRWSEKVLTGNDGSSFKNIHELVVDLDHLFLLVEELFVAILDLSFNPLLELRSNDSVNDVDEPLTRHPKNVLIIWHTSLDFSDFAPFAQQLFDSEVLVVRHSQVFDLVGLEP